ncbi:MAG TPA: HAMP domain-containing sensor histidine kinase, partial [Thermoanaerobaculia bacterium]|nr:HAMP domain-containing sensor histidine kinase [Thermoanaerobaculia bacterium]
TARRVDREVQSELARVSEGWQQRERRLEAPAFTDLQQWIQSSDWIVSAIYLPDDDPASSVYASKLPERTDHPRFLTREFLTATGTVRFSYDAEKLIARAEEVVRQLPLKNRPDGMHEQAEVKLVRSTPEQGLFRSGDGFAFVAPLNPPLAGYGVRAFVRTAYIGSGWENPRAISLWLSFIALTLTAVGGYLAHRGMKKEQETMNLRGALIANVSHELRTPLSMIRLGAETLRRGTRLTEKERQEIEDQVLREVLHLSHLVENVLDVARMQHRQTKALAFTPVYPRELVTSVVSTYESWIRSKGFTVTLQIDENVAEQSWDRDAVSRALLNLIDNAIKYSADDKSIEVVLRQSPEHVILEVKDRGIGIAAKDLEHIFDPYFRAQFSDTQTRRGAGLGLTLVQQIVASHGGRVEVESEPGRGSAFRLLFPRAGGTAEEPVTEFARAREAF